jgi:hypothetical protein
MLSERRSDLSPASSSFGVTYSEIRDWAWWLQMFTAADLADAMGVSHWVAERAVTALLWHGVCEDTETVDGLGERVISYVPLPPGPREHATQAPEWRTCTQDLVPPHRGMPVRLVDNTERRNQMQGTGGARIRIKQRDAAYEAMQAAKEERVMQQRAKIDKEKQGKTNKQKGKTRTHAVEP